MQGAKVSTTAWSDFREAYIKAIIVILLGYWLYSVLSSNHIASFELFGFCFTAYLAASSFTVYELYKAHQACDEEFFSVGPVIFISSVCAICIALVLMVF